MFNSLILPRCCDLVTAIGHRMAYEAAEASDIVSPEMLDLFEASCIMEDPGWYVEQKKLSMSAIHKRHAQAVGALLPRLDAMLQQTAAAPWATAPILREQDWENFLDNLPLFTNGETISTGQLSGSGSAGSNVTVQDEWGSKEEETDVTDEELVTKGEVYVRKVDLAYDVDKPVPKRRGWRGLLKSIC